jgi:hypothetical protein
MNPDEKIITKLEVLNKNLILKLQQTCKGSVAKIILLPF